MGKRIDGKQVSMDVKLAVKDEVSALKEQGVSVCLAVVIVGNDPASRIYVNNKKKACELVGIESREYALPEETSELLAGGAASMDRCVCFYAAANHIPCRSCPPKKQPDGGAAVPAGKGICLGGSGT